MELPPPSVNTGNFSIDNGNCISICLYFQETPTTELEESSSAEGESGASNARVDAEPQPEEAVEESDIDNIRIRLKYLNEDQKLVRGKLHELLGDFKRCASSIIVFDYVEDEEGVDGASFMSQ